MRVLKDSLIVVDPQEGQPLVLKVVKKAELNIVLNPNINKVKEVLLVAKVLPINLFLL